MIVLTVKDSSSQLNVAKEKTFPIDITDMTYIVQIETSKYEKAFGFAL